MANGFALSALVGRREVMELGGLHHDRDRVFLLSTTHGAETHALAAAIATMKVYREKSVIEALYGAGERLRQGIEGVVRELGLGDHFQVVGKAPNLVCVTRDQEGEPSQAFRTLFLQETIERGFIMPSLVVSFSHGPTEIELTIDAIGEALTVYAKALEHGIDRYLKGRAVKPVYRRFN
jgi:glutamate-1-semialdehyde 2,1-aminomutase